MSGDVRYLVVCAGSLVACYGVFRVLLRYKCGPREPVLGRFHISGWWFLAAGLALVVAPLFLWTD